jgi:two-component system NtrC family response regulator
MSEGSQITAKDLELESSTAESSLPLNLRHVREHAERQALSKALSYVNGNLSQAAEILGITRPTLYALLNKYDMKT